MANDSFPIRYDDDDDDDDDDEDNDDVISDKVHIFLQSSYEKGLYWKRTAPQSAWQIMESSDWIDWFDNDDKTNYTYSQNQHKREG